MGGVCRVQGGGDGQLGSLPGQLLTAEPGRSHEAWQCSGGQHGSTDDDYNECILELARRRKREGGQVTMTPTPFWWMALGQEVLLQKAAGMCTSKGSLRCCSARLALSRQVLCCWRLIHPFPLHPVAIHPEGVQERSVRARPNNAPDRIVVGPVDALSGLPLSAYSHAPRTRTAGGHHSSSPGLPSSPVPLLIQPLSPPTCTGLASIHGREAAGPSSSPFRARGTGPAIESELVRPSATHHLASRGGTGKVRP